MKLLWLGYLVYSFGNCAMKLCIEMHQNEPGELDGSLHQ